MSEPTHVSQALSQLFALRGYARTQGNAQLQQVWAEVAGPEVAKSTKVGALQRGVLEVFVASSPLLGELTSFHKANLLAALKQRRPDLRVRDLKFRLRTGVRGS